MACCVFMAAILAGVLGIKAAVFGRADGRAQDWRLEADDDRKR